MWTDSNLITEQWPNIIHSPSTEHGESFELEIIRILSAQQQDASKTELSKLNKQLLAKQNLVTLAIAKLSDNAFIKNAPSDVVSAEEQRLSQAKQAIITIQNAIQNLSKA